MADILVKNPSGISPQTSFLMLGRKEALDDPDLLMKHDKTQVELFHSFRPRNKDLSSVTRARATEILPHGSISANKRRTKGAFGRYNGVMTTGASILERIIEPERGGFSNEHAQYVLSLDFSSEEQARYAELARKVQDGALTEQEEAELNEFVTANALLTILQSKARISLKKHSPAA